MSNVPPPPPPMQPAAGGRAAGAPIPNYLVQSILVTLFCCLPAGVVSIVFAAQVNSKVQAGDYAGAAQASKTAKTWAWVSFGIGVGVAVLYLLIFVVAAAVSS